MGLLIVENLRTLVETISNLQIRSGVLYHYLRILLFRRIHNLAGLTLGLNIQACQILPIE